ncbi:MULTISPECIES: serine hydrolase domain-containing protein [Streptomyces]|uniref:serine hydrolase domain-containing protein n=1 Tax=Streptomyces TaxID=1883 RepID=UPI00163CA24B|nr:MULTISPECIES: serine hydrolase domain-containing protein [Streptomyces]MBC2876956.1 serine hydrolase [Streptomyces sp. TYQ1024]UBI35982.1 beta-lactamase family protein [Streptomyces mobaraensis]UKW28575.1 beta-lactamase family protein [Streptomyces sp. TYQ1024]
MEPVPNALDGLALDPIGTLAADPRATAERLAALPSVVGVQVAGVTGGTVNVGAAGLADAETGEPMTTGTRFRVGSITKLLTADLVMRCVLDGLVGLDDPLARFVPGPWDGVLVRHLLSHSSGLDAGDIFVDTGNDDDAIARYVEVLRGAGSLFPPGAAFSYCNGGVVLAGRLVEVLLGRTWREALHEKVLDAASMRETGFVTGVDAEHDRGTVRGHVVRGGDGEPAVLPRRIDHPMCTRGLDPAGGTLVSTAADLGRFTLAQMRRPGTEVMRTLHIPAPGGVATMLGAGFGWMIWANAVQSSVRVGGANPGQSGLIAADPATRTAVVVLTNSDQGIDAVTALLDRPGPPPGPGPGPGPVHVSRYAGRYVSQAAVVDITPTGDGLLARIEGHPALPLAPRDRRTFDSPGGPVAFLGFDDQGTPDSLRFRMRVMRRDDST